MQSATVANQSSVLSDHLATLHDDFDALCVAASEMAYNDGKINYGPAFRFLMNLEDEFQGKFHRLERELEAARARCFGEASRA